MSHTLNYQTLAFNCEQLNIPVPLIAMGYPGGDNQVGVRPAEPAYGSLPILLNRNGTDAVYDVATGATPGPKDPFLSFSASLVATNRAFFSPNLYIAGNLTALIVVTNRRQLLNTQLSYLGKGNSLGTTTEWFIGGNNHSTTTDYLPRFLVSVGGVVAKCADTTPWAINERLVLAGVRAYGNIFLYRAGVQVATAACGTGAIDNAASQIDICGLSDVGTFNAQADVELTLVWDQIIPPDVLALLAVDPLGILFDDFDDDPDYTDLRGTVQGNAQTYLCGGF